MRTKHEQIVICKADLTSIILNKRNNLDLNTLNELKAKLLLIKNLKEEIRHNEDINCQDQITDVKNYILSIK